MQERFYTNSISQNSVNEMETPFTGFWKKKKQQQKTPVKPPNSVFLEYPLVLLGGAVG